VLLQYAEIHHHKDARLLCFLGGFLIDDALLHPYRWNFQLNRLIDNILHLFWPAKDIYDVDFLRNTPQRRVRLFSQ
jgi:hypothetical protein